MDDWVDMGFESGAIAIAYDKTVTKTGNLTWPYIDKIIKNWHSKGLHTEQQVLDYDSAQKNGKTGSRQTQGSWRSASTSTQKHGEPNRADIERMQRLLDKTKGD